MTTTKFYECLFDKTELTTHGDNIYAIHPTKAIANGIKEEKPFFVINPIRPGATRSIEGVAKFRNFLFEIDEDSEKNIVPIEKQKELVHLSGMPWSTCVYSGGKSLHWIISLENPVEDESEYRMYWKMMEFILNKTAKTLGYNLKFDSNVKDPSRFSRAANSLRVDKQKIQDLIEVKGRQANSILLRWFEDHDVKFEDFIPKPSKFEIGQINEYAGDNDKIDFITNTLMKNQPYEKGGMNSWQFSFSRLARRCNITESDCRAAINKICGEIDHRDPVASAYSDKYSNDAPIYVLSKAERSAWARRRQLDEDIQRKQQIVESGAADDYLHVNGVLDYRRIGTQYYLKSSDELILWNKDTLVSDFGSDTIKQFPDELKYKKFCNIIDFINPIEDSKGEYNMFQRPKWTPSKGEWKTTEKLLRKVFTQCGEDQWEAGLDWIQLQLTNPKQMLHCLILGSQSREAGKDTFVEWMKMLLGKNNVYFSDIENFLKPFNSAYASKCLIALNEVKFSSINDGSMEKIKQYITQDTVLIEAKFEKPVEIDYCGKMIMLTNNVHDFMRIDDEENRFWIRTMPDLDKNIDFDPLFKDKLRNELPHFIHYILERRLYHQEKSSRFYLPDSITHTKELKNIRDNSKSSLYLEIHQMIDDTFFNRKDTDELFFVLNDVREKIKSDKGPKEIKMCLLKEFGLVAHKMARTNSYTNEERNSSYFHVLRSEFYQTPDSTPGLGEVFTL